MNIIGLDLGGTKLSGAIFDKEGNYSERHFELLGNKKGSGVGKVIVETIDRLREKISRKGEELSAVGICVPGIVNPVTKEVWAPNIPGWDSYRLDEEIKVFLDNSHIPVVVNNDRICYLYGECWKGNAAGCKDVIFMAVGTGIGAGIMSGGNIIRGGNDISGAVGWMTMSCQYQEKYKATGFFEYYASGPGLVNLTNEIMSDGSLHSGYFDKKKFNSQDIFRALDAGDGVAIRVLEQAVRYWGAAVANLVSIFNPEKIIFGGGVFGPGTKLLDSIKKEARNWAQPLSMNYVEITHSLLGSDAGLYGAAGLAIAEINKQFKI